MFHHRRRRCATALLALLLLLPAVSGPARAADPFPINAILALTGPSSFVGKGEKETLDVIAQLVNARGGINGQPIAFVYADDQSNPQVGVQLVSDLIAKGAPFILGPSGTNVCEAIFPLIQKAERVSWCFSPAVHHPDSYMFSASVDTADLAKVMLRYFRARGWTQVAVIATIDAAGREFEKSYLAAAALPENASVRTVAFEHMNPTDITATAQLTRIKAAAPNVLIAWSIGPPTGTFLRGISDAALHLPVALSNANMTYVQMAQYAPFLPQELLFPTSRAIGRDLIAKGRVVKQQDFYFESFKAAGIRPDAANALAWDPMYIILDALRKLGPAATGPQIRSYVEALYNYDGVSGTYDFRNGAQRGLGEGAAVMDRWDPKKNDFVTISKPGGAL